MTGLLWYQNMINYFILHYYVGKKVTRALSKNFVISLGEIDGESFENDKAAFLASVATENVENQKGIHYRFPSPINLCIHSFLNYF